MKPLAILFFAAALLISCNKNEEIRRQLNSRNPSDIIRGTYAAGQSGNKEFVPLLLHNAADPSCGADIRFKGFSVYTEKMYALQKILGVKPPHNYQGLEISPDSTNIKFYTQYWENVNKRN